MARHADAVSLDNFEMRAYRSFLDLPSVVVSSTDELLVTPAKVRTTGRHVGKPRNQSQSREGTFRRVYFPVSLTKDVAMPFDFARSPPVGR